MIRTTMHLCLVVLLIAASSLSLAQERRYSALIPAFHSRLVASGHENVLELKHQRFVLFVYRNAVAVSAEADFVNTGPDTLSLTWTCHVSAASTICDPLDGTRRSGQGTPRQGLQRHIER